MITFTANRHELRGGEKLLSFHIMEFGQPKAAIPASEEPRISP
jgi:hypothetical protein